MRFLLVQFGSFKCGESRDQDYVAFPYSEELRNLFPEAVVVDSVGETAMEIINVTLEMVSDPDIWLWNQEDDMKPIIVANLMKDYPHAAEAVQQLMRIWVDISGGDEALLESMKKNVLRWMGALPHIPNLRKRVFSNVQREAYARKFGFFNTKSEIARACVRLFPNICSTKEMLDFLMGTNEYNSDFLQKILRLWAIENGIKKSYRSKNGCIGELPEFSQCSVSRLILTKMGVTNGLVNIRWEETYTYSTNHGETFLEPAVWEMLLRLDLEEVS